MFSERNGKSDFGNPPFFVLLSSNFFKIFLKINFLQVVIIDSDECQNDSGAHCTFEIALSQAITLTLLLVCAFFSTQVQKYLAWVL